MSGMYRNGRNRPTFDSVALFTLIEPDSAGHGGLGELTARRLLATAERIEWIAGDPRLPKGKPPTEQEIPADDNGWVAWWEAGGIHNPPRIDARPAPSAGKPFVWQAEGRVGGTSWGLPVLQAFRLPCDAKDIRGAERTLSDPAAEIATTTTSMMIARQAIAPILADWESGAAFANAWAVALNSGSARDIVEVIETHDRRFVRVLTEDRR